MSSPPGLSEIFIQTASLTRKSELTGFGTGTGDGGMGELLCVVRVN